MRNIFRRTGASSVKLQSVNVNIPYVGGFTFVPDEVQAKAAWSIYVELSTRVGVQPFDPANSSPREALESIYAMFGETRRVLSASGPGVARGRNSFGPLALEFLNRGLRPFLTKWHPEFLTFESAIGHEFDGQPTPDWTQLKKFVEDFEILKENLNSYSQQLLIISGANVHDGNVQSGSS